MAVANPDIDRIIRDLVRATHPQLRKWVDIGEITAVKALWNERVTATTIRIAFKCGLNVTMEFDVWGRNDVSFADDQMKLLCLLKAYFTDEKIVKLALIKEAKNGETICMEF